MRIAIMQPYTFPYIGYFQLIAAVDTFVFLDDVSFAKKGFINRNSILLEGRRHPFVIPCKGVSQNKLIKDTEIALDPASARKLLEKIRYAYNKARAFDVVYPMISDFLNKNQNQTISEFAIESVRFITQYLDINVNWVVSSEHYAFNRDLGAEDRLIDIVKRENGDTYINPIGGMELYSKENFRREGIDLKFLKSDELKYHQFDADFVPWLSILDVVMFNRPEEIKPFLNACKLI